MQRRAFLGGLACSALAGCAATPSTGGGEPAVLGVIEYGQSNSEAQAGQGAALLRTAYPAGLRMPATAADNVWLGLTTVGGRSLELAQGAVTGLAPLRGAMGSPTHGSTAGESMVLRLVEDRAAGPEIVLFNAAEGGQAIRRLARAAPPGFYGFTNLVRAATAVNAALRAEGKRYVVRVVAMAQGETDAKDARLGALQEAVRAEIETAVQGVTGQPEGVWLLTVQPSSFLEPETGSGVRDILAEHERSRARAGRFFCLGPTYNFPFSSDWLHSTSVGHDMRGELYAVAYESLLRTGSWDVLRATGARVDGANRVAVTLSEPAAIEPIERVPPVEHLGLALAGAQIASVAVEGNRILIDTVGPAAQATAVRIALAGQGARRSGEGLPRTSIRSKAGYGRYRNGATIRKWLCHQEVAL